MHNQMMEYYKKIRNGSRFYSCCRHIALFLFHPGLGRNHPLRFTLIVISLSLYSHFASASGTNILMVKSGDDSVYNKVAHSAVQRLENFCATGNRKCLSPTVSIKTIGREIDHGMLTSGKWDLIVTIGTKAANLVSSSGTHTPTLYSLIPSNRFNRIRKNGGNKNISAIFIDQPIARQLSLVKAVLPERKNVGIILGKYSTIGKSRLKRILYSNNLNPIISYANPESIGMLIEGKLKKINVLLALPDPSIYNKKTVLKILLSSYRHQVPIIGYSDAFVKSGAIAAVFSTPGDIGMHTGEVIGKFSISSSSNLPSPSYPKYFSINVNQSVSNSLNIRMPSISTIKSRLLKAYK